MSDSTEFSWRALELLNPGRRLTSGIGYDSPLFRMAAKLTGYGEGPSVLLWRQAPVWSRSFAAARQERVEDQHEQPVPAPVFNPPAVETIRWDAVTPWLSPSGRYAVEAILSEDVFRERVLPAVATPAQTAPRTRMAHAWVRELFHTGYLRPRQAARGTPVVECPIFAVDRSDGRLRLIFDGRVLNSICRLPPRCALPAVRADLRWMFVADRVVVLDFRSWFVQLTPSAAVAEKYFGTSLPGGTSAVLTGLPMGFAWAPVIAQEVSEAFIRAVRPRTPWVMGSSAYIDNVAFGLPTGRSSDADVATLVQIIKDVATEMGIEIKESSWGVGPIVEWRGLEVDVPGQRWRFKEAFRHKMRDSTQRAVEQGWTIPVGESIAMISCAIYVAYVRGRPMASLVDMMRWLSRLATQLASEAIDWSHLMRWPRAASIEMMSMKESLSTEWTSPPTAVPPSDQRIFGVSDAAGGESGGNLWAYVCHTPLRMVAVAVPIGNERDIFKLELRAMTAGLLDAVRDVDAGVRLAWLCDNLRALFVVRRGWSADWQANEAILSLWDRVLPHASVSSLSFVPSAYNAADALTRGTQPVSIVRPACPTHPGTACPEFDTFVREIVRLAGSESRRLPRTVSWATAPSVVRFTTDMPVNALMGFFPQ